MPVFKALQDIPEALPGVTLHWPVIAGEAVVVTAEEAIVLRARPRLFEEIGRDRPARPLGWHARAQRNTMVAHAEQIKGTE